MVTARAANIINGTVATVIRVSHTLVYTIRQKVPTTLMELEMICTTVLFSISPTASTSLVKRLMMSPWLFVS